MMQTQMQVMKQVMNQVKIDQSNQLGPMGPKPMQGPPPNMQTHVQNINAQNVAMQNMGMPPQSVQAQMGQAPNQIQIQPIQQQQQPNQMQPPNQQMQQIGVDQSGQMQFVNTAPPGNSGNFNVNSMPPQQQQQMKVVQHQQINIQQQQPPQGPQQQQQMQVSENENMGWENVMKCKDCVEMDSIAKCLQFGTILSFRARLSN